MDPRLLNKQLLDQTTNELYIITGTGQVYVIPNTVLDILKGRDIPTPIRESVRIDPPLEEVRVYSGKLATTPEELAELEAEIFSDYSDEEYVEDEEELDEELEQMIVKPSRPLQELLQIVPLNRDTKMSNKPTWTEEAEKTYEKPSSDLIEIVIALRKLGTSVSCRAGVRHTKREEKLRAATQCLRHRGIVLSMRAFPAKKSRSRRN